MYRWSSNENRQRWAIEEKHFTNRRLTLRFTHPFRLRDGIAYLASVLLMMAEPRRLFRRWPSMDLLSAKRGSHPAPQLSTSSSSAQSRLKQVSASPALSVHRTFPLAWDVEASASIDALYSWTQWSLAARAFRCPTARTPEHPLSHVLDGSPVITRGVICLFFGSWPGSDVH